MAEDPKRLCVLLPLAGNLRWVVPQNCLAELVTVHAAQDTPPATIAWREQVVPVLDFGAEDSTPWCDAKSQTGLIAVFLGLREQPLEYWGVALRGAGLGVRKLDLESGVEVAAEGEFALAAVELEGQVYTLPDLPALQAFTCEQNGMATA